MIDDVHGKGSDVSFVTGSVSWVILSTNLHGFICKQTNGDPSKVPFSTYIGSRTKGNEDIMFLAKLHKV